MPARQPSLSSIRHRRLAPGWIALWMALALLAGPWLQAIAADTTPQTDIAAMAICSTSGMQTSPGSLPLHAASHCQLCCGSHAPPLPVSGQAVAAFSAASYPQPVRPSISLSLRPIAMPALARAPPVA